VHFSLFKWLFYWQNQYLVELSPSFCTGLLFFKRLLTILITRIKFNLYFTVSYLCRFVLYLLKYKTMFLHNLQSSGTYVHKMCILLHTLITTPSTSMLIGGNIPMLYLGKYDSYFYMTG